MRVCLYFLLSFVSLRTLSGTRLTSIYRRYQSSLQEYFSRTRWAPRSGRKISNYVWRPIDFSLRVYPALYWLKTSLVWKLERGIGGSGVRWGRARGRGDAGIPLTFNEIATAIQLLEETRLNFLMTIIALKLCANISSATARISFRPENEKCAVAEERASNLALS